MAQPPSQPTPPPARRYVYVWEFQVASVREGEFLKAYGPAGAWARLFQKAAGYLETTLLQDQTAPGRFLTVDRWSSQAAHDAFLTEFRTEYDALDGACESLTLKENCLGSFWEFVPPADSARVS